MARIAQTALLPGFLRYQNEYEQAALDILRSGSYILGPKLAQFESDFANYLGRDGTIYGVASGLDSLVIAFRALEIGDGDEVIVPANTFIASVMGITRNGATPVFVEPNKYYNIDVDKIESAITNRTRAVLAVHLYGQSCEMDKIVAICEKYNLKLVEDCAQSHGASFNGQKTGTFGDVGCFSFYPTKNMGAFGDGGAIWCRTSEVAEKVKMLRNYGSNKRYHNRFIGYNSRLDEIQAALLTVKLKYLDGLNAERQNIAKRYSELIKNPMVVKPEVLDGVDHVYHQFVIKMPSQDLRDDMINHLKKNEIDSNIHYPIPPHLAECYKYLGYKIGDLPIAEKFSNTIISIPIFNGITSSQVNKTVEEINLYE